MSNSDPVVMRYMPRRYIAGMTVTAQRALSNVRFSSLEIKFVQTHAQAGYDILKNLPFPWPVAQVALQHHERMQGGGYPHGIAGDAILLESRIVAIADVVESICSHRPYRAARGIDVALAVIKEGASILFDADAVQACLRLFRDMGYSIPA